MPNTSATISAAGSLFDSRQHAHARIYLFDCHDGRPIVVVVWLGRATSQTLKGAAREDPVGREDDQSLDYQNPPDAAGGRSPRKRRQRAAVAEGRPSGGRVGRDDDDAIWPCHPASQVGRAWLAGLGSLPSICFSVVHDSAFCSVPGGDAEFHHRWSQVEIGTLHGWHGSWEPFQAR